MQEHFWHLHFKTFPMVSWKPNLVFGFLFNQWFKHLGSLHKCNFQSGSALGNHWAPMLFYTFPHLRECVSHPNTPSWPHGPLHSIFRCELYGKVATCCKNMDAWNAHCFQVELHIQICIKCINSFPQDYNSLISVCKYMCTFVDVKNSLPRMINASSKKYFLINC